MRTMTVLGMALLVVGCSGGDGVASDTASAAESASPPPSLSVVTPSPSATVSASPTTAPSATPALPVDSVAQVVTTDLVLRSAPGTDPESEIYGTLDEPTLLYVLGGPVSASGYAWYQVYAYGSFVFTPISSGGPETRLGWVAAAAKDGEPWIGSASLNCVEQPQIEDLFELGVGALACYGDRELTFPAVFRGADYVTPCAVSPGWLFCTGYHLTPLLCAFECPALTPTPRGGEPSLFVHGGAEPSLFVHGGRFDYPSNTAVQVVGHFDDPAAQSCVSGLLPGGYVPPAAEIILQCRAHFVVMEVTSITR